MYIELIKDLTRRIFRRRFWKWGLFFTFSYFLSVFSTKNVFSLAFSIKKYLKMRFHQNMSSFSCSAQKNASRSPKHFLKYFISHSMYYVEYKLIKIIKIILLKLKFIKKLVIFLSKFFTSELRTSKLYNSKTWGLTHLIRHF